MKKFLKFSCFVCILSATLYILSSIFCVSYVKDPVHIKCFFKEPENSLDVLLIGPSELYSDFSSPVAWNEYGFTSYALCYSGMTAEMYEPVLHKALKSQSPKLIVFEINPFILEEDEVLENSKAHCWFYSINKDIDDYKYINSLVPADQRFEFYFPFYKYHENWTKPDILLENIINNTYVNIYGASYTKSLANRASARDTDKLTSKSLSFSSKSKEKLISLLDYCKQNKLENVLFIRTPHCIINTDKNAYSEIETIINKYGYKFENYDNSYDLIGVDVKTDFLDEEHLNISGMEKFTKFLGKHITDNYFVKSNHPKEIADFWDECFRINSQVFELAKSSNDDKAYNEVTAYKLAHNIELD